jgi:hypothetical protein
MSKDLILTYATNIRFEDFYRFVVSARRACSVRDVDVVVCIDALDDRYARLALEHGVTLLPVQNVWKWARGSKWLNAWLYMNLVATRLLAALLPAGHGQAFADLHRRYAADWIFPQSGRWIVLQDFLKVNCAYRHVFLTDARDVVFQDNPFAGLAPGEVHVFEQAGIRYGEDNMDTQWYRSVYRKALPERLVGKPVLCCGTVLGDRTTLMKVLDSWVPDIIRLARRPVEQPMFNEALSREAGRVDVVRHELGSGSVLTVCGDHHGTWEIADGTVNVAGRPVPVIHMYDRDERMKALVESNYPLTDA